MKLKCLIKDKEYDIVQGAYFSEEYNEKLDSGAIIIDQVSKIDDMKPYDDVIIYDSEVYNQNNPFNGYGWFRTLQQPNVDNISYVIIRPINGKTVKILIQEDLYNQIYQNKILSPETMGYEQSNKINVYISYVYDAEMPSGDVYYKTEQLEVSNSAIVPDFNQNIFFTTEIVIDNNWVREDEYYTLTYTTESDSISLADIQQGNLEISNFCVFVNHLIEHDGFYKHLLIDQFSEERLNPIENIFKYKTELFSETKKLEAIQLPNKSITEPLNISKKKSIWYYLQTFTQLYSPLKKIQVGRYVVNDNVYIQWANVTKYKISDDLKPIFEDTYSPDFTLNLPNLKDILTRLMQVKDMIPYVKDDVIYGLEYTKRDYTPFNTNGIISITSSMTSSDFCNNLRTNYSNALSEFNTVHMIDRTGFRNTDNAILAIDNLTISTRYPIYKINSIIACYYKKVFLYDPIEQTTKEYVLLCKQDLTPFVLLNTTRNFLSAQWDELIAKINANYNLTVEEAAQYKMCTIGYDIGSNNIAGWGQKYSVKDLSGMNPYWWNFTFTFIQNILTFLDKKNPFGYNNLGTIKQGDKIYYLSNLASSNLFSDGLNRGTIVITDKDIDGATFSPTIAEEIKSVFFEIDYTAFYNGAVVHSKDQVLEDDITINDNSSSSLILLEQEGIFQKTKVNRFGNKTYNIAARYNGSYEDFINTNKLGQVYQENIIYDDADHFGSDDIIIYHRDYAIFDNFINMNYIGAESAVLKNYFHNVYAKHRTWNLMPYGESVNRSDNQKCFIMLTKNNIYKQEDFNNFSFLNFNDSTIAQQLLSFFTMSKIIDSKMQKNKDNNLFSSIVIYNDDNTCSLYNSDVNLFISGNSLCINIKMFDSVSGGVRITKLTPDIGFFVYRTDQVEDDYKGTQQGNYIIVDDNETGYIDKMGFLFGKINDNSLLNNSLIDVDKTLNDSLEQVSDLYNKYIFQLPKIKLYDENSNDFKSNIKFDETVFTDNLHNVILYQGNFNKDNKENIDMTLQFEIVTNDSQNIIISPWLLRLSELNGRYNKIAKTFYINDIEGNLSGRERSLSLISNFDVIYSTTPSSGSYIDSEGTAADLEINIDIDDRNFLENLAETLVIDYPLYFNFDFSNKTLSTGFGYETINCKFNVKQMEFFEYNNEHFANLKVEIVNLEAKIKFFPSIFDIYTFDPNTTRAGQIRDNVLLVFKQVGTNGSKIIYKAYNIEAHNVAGRCYYEITPYVDPRNQQEGEVYRITTRPWDGFTETNNFIINGANNIPYYYPFPQNIFIGLYDETINKNFIYEQYSDANQININKNYNIESVVYYNIDSQNVPCITVDFKPFKNLEQRPQSIALWYYENSDATKDFYALENISSPETYSQEINNITAGAIIIDDITFYIYSFEISYNDINIDGINGNTVQCVNIDISDSKINARSILNDTTGIKVEVISDANFTSLQYTLTFFTGNDYLTNGAYHFVFGLNISDEDWERGSINLYYSLLKNKNLKVYNDKNEVIGKVHNYYNDSNLGYEESETLNLKNVANYNDYITAINIPNIRFDEENPSKLIWDSVDHAKEYNIIIRNANNAIVAQTTTTDLFLELNSLIETNGNYYIYIQSISEDITKYKNSRFSSPVPYTKS